VTVLPAARVVPVHTATRVLTAFRSSRLVNVEPERLRVVVTATEEPVPITNRPVMPVVTPAGTVMLWVVAEVDPS
jgi:hypothetical protein